MSKYVTDCYPISSAGGIRISTSILSSAANYTDQIGRTVKYIVLHYTGNARDTAENNAKYFRNGSRGASAHYFIDETACYQSVALKDRAWAVGGTSVYKHSDCRNANSVSVEMCCSGNYIVSKKTIENAAQLTAALCGYLGIAADAVDAYVLRHYDIWDKKCPKQWASESSGGWRAFKTRVREIMNGGIDMEEINILKAEMSAMRTKYDLIISRMGKEIEELKPTIYDYIDGNMPEWAREGVRWCVDNGVIKGVGGGRLGLDDKDLKYCTMIMRMCAH